MPNTTKTKPESEKSNVGPSSAPSKKSGKTTSEKYQGTLFPWEISESRQKLLTEKDRLAPTHKGYDYAEERDKECCTIV